MTSFASSIAAVRKMDAAQYLGKIDKVIGITIEATGLKCNIGEVVKIFSGRTGNHTMAEVVGFKSDRILLMPFGDITGIGSGDQVEYMGDVLRIPVGQALIGRVLNGLGEPIDEKGELNVSETYPVTNNPSNPLDRPRIDQPLTIGVKAIDGLLTCGKGQRIGIFSGSGVGKSTLMGMIARNIDVDVNIIALVGERGREVWDFIQRDLGEAGMKKSILVVATSDQPAMVRKKCALTAVTMAEYFKDKGKNVLLMMDSLTRFAMAQREIGLAIGEPPVARGYTPSIYSEMPKLLERSGNFKNGSITGIYTVLVEGDDVNEPISDTVRGIVDGHIVLSRSVAMKNHYPAIDILGSISRLMNDIVADEHREIANKMRYLLSVYSANADLISIGAYKAGMNAELDKAVAAITKIDTFLCQKVEESFTYEETVELMMSAVS